MATNRRNITGWLHHDLPPSECAARIRRADARRADVREADAECSHIAIEAMSRLSDTLASAYSVDEIVDALVEELAYFDVAIAAYAAAMEAEETYYAELEAVR